MPLTQNEISQQDDQTLAAQALETALILAYEINQKAALFDQLMQRVVPARFTNQLMLHREIEPKVAKITRVLKRIGSAPGSVKLRAS